MAKETEASSSDQLDDTATANNLVNSLESRRRLRFNRALNRINSKIVIGSSMVLLIFLFGSVGPFFIDVENAEVASARPGQSPNTKHWLGTDVTGRDMLAWLIVSTPQTLRVGFVAGALGVIFGAVIGFIAGYYRGMVDTLLRNFTDTMLAIPSLLVLIVLASLVDVITLDQMSIVIAAFAWMGAARIIRAQALSLRERQYVEIAKMSGERGAYIVFFEMMPNMLPFMLAAFVSSVIASIGTSVGLFFLGLGPLSLNTLGNILFWAQSYQAFIIGYWWWWSPPVVIFIILFSGLFIASIGLDEWANPRLRERA